MSYQHKQLAAGRWAEFSFMEQMANIGSEAGRALEWSSRGNKALSLSALNRTLELLYLTVEANTVPSRYKELARVREIILDFFEGGNEFNTTGDFLQEYFLQFARACRRGR